MTPLLTLLLLLVTAVWGWSFTAMKDAIAVYGIVAFLAMRFGLGWASLQVLTPRRISASTWLVGGGIGVVLAAGHLLQTFGLRHTTASNTGLITGLYIVFGPLVARALFGVRIRGVAWCAVGLSLVGLALLTGGGPGPVNQGDLLTLAGAVCYGFHLALVDRYARRYDAKELAIAQLGAATAVFVIVCPMDGPFAWPPTAGVWTAIVVTGIFATGLAFYIQTLAQQRLPVVRTAVILSMEPAFAALFGHLLAGERFAPVQLAGGVVMIAAVLLAEVGPAWIDRMAE